MKRLSDLFVICALAGGLAACNAPFVTTIPTTPAPATSEPLQQVLPTASLPTETSLASTATALPPTETPAPGPALVISQIHMLDANKGWGWATKADNTFQLLRSMDGGQTWVDASPQQPVAPNVESFLDDQTAWVPFYDPTSNSSVLLHTSDGGKTWISLPPIQGAENARYEFSSPQDGVAETAGLGAGNLYLNLYETHDGGANWAPILIKAPNVEPGLPAGTVHLCNICGDSLYYDAERSVIAYGSMANDAVSVVSLAVSTDLGEHWTNLKLPFPNRKYAKGLVAPQTPTFFGADGLMPVNILNYKSDGSMAFSILAMYSTHNGGKSWSPAAGILDNGTAQSGSVQILSMQNAFVRCGKNLCETSDGGQTWLTLPNSLNFDSSAGGADYVSYFEFTGPNDGWAISGEAAATILWKTSDGGNTWVKLAPTLSK